MHKIQPDAVARKAKDAKREYEKLKRTVDLRKGAVAPDDLPAKVKVEDAKARAGIGGVIELLKDQMKDEKVVVLCLRALADEAREAMLPPVYGKKSSAFNAYADKYADPDEDRAMVIGAKGGIRQIIRAGKYYPRSKTVVLRSCWALEYAVLLDSNRTIFEREGGITFLASIESGPHRNDKEIVKSIKKLEEIPTRLTTMRPPAASRRKCIHSFIYF